MSGTTELTAAELLFALAADDDATPETVVATPAGHCAFCRQPVNPYEKGDAAPAYAATERGVELCHAGCRNEITGKAVTPMATYSRVSKLPPCAVCGRPWVNHNRPITDIWAAECTPDEHRGRTYQPAEPFREHSYPHRMIAGFDHATDEMVFADGTREKPSCAPAPAPWTDEERLAFEAEYARGYGVGSLFPVPAKRRRKKSA
jgi:hypothetical protein